MTLSHDDLRSRLHYDPDTGIFRWSGRHAICLAAGDVAGRVAINGYRHIKIKYVAYLAHRLAWFYVHGEWPTGQIDHINGDRDDNRLANLRDVTASENLLNRHSAQSNKTGYPGVYRKRGRFGARLIVNGRQRYLGVYATPEEAHAVYLQHRATESGLAAQSHLTVLEELQATKVAA